MLSWTPPACRWVDAHGFLLALPVRQRNLPAALLCCNAADVHSIAGAFPQPSRCSSHIAPLPASCPLRQPDVLRELQANLPDASELDALHAYLDSGGNPGQLGKAEQLFVALRRTARLQQRLQVLSFMGSLPEAAGEVAQPLSRIAEALDQLRASGQLRLLLHTALRLGNALNAGRKAPQRGIRLASLRCGAAGGSLAVWQEAGDTAWFVAMTRPSSFHQGQGFCRTPPSLYPCRKLADTRSMDGSTTLVHYLTALMLDSAPGVSAAAC